jgi:adenylate cyclase
MGVAVNAGVAYVGNVGDAVVDFTALGDTVNVGARMQGEASSGELLMREGIGSPATGTPRRTLNLRGHEEPIEVLVVTA